MIALVTHQVLILYISEVSIIILFNLLTFMLLSPILFVFTLFSSCFLLTVSFSSSSYTVQNSPLWNASKNNNNIDHVVLTGSPNFTNAGSIYKFNRTLTSTYTNVRYIVASFSGHQSLVP